MGSDGETDGKAYVVTDLAVFSQERNNGLGKNSAGNLTSKGAAKELSIVLPAGATSEGQVYQDLYNDAVGTITPDNPKGNEQAIQFVMNADAGTISFSRVESKGFKNGFPRSGPGHVQMDTPEEIGQKFGSNAASFGDVHTHQAENYSSVEESMTVNSRGPDGANARRAGKTSYSIGAMGSNIKHSPKESSVLGPNTKVFSGEVSLVQDALQSLHRQ